MNRVMAELKIDCFIYDGENTDVEKQVIECIKRFLTINCGNCEYAYGDFDLEVLPNVQLTFIDQTYEGRLGDVSLENCTVEGKSVYDKIQKWISQVFEWHSPHNDLNEYVKFVLRYAADSHFIIDCIPERDPSRFYSAIVDLSGFYDDEED